MQFMLYTILYCFTATVTTTDNDVRVIIFIALQSKQY